MKKNRNNLSIGDIILYDGAFYSVIRIRTENIGVHGDNWYVSVCKELDNDLVIKNNGNIISILRGSNNFFEDSLIDVLIKIL